MSNKMKIDWSKPITTRSGRAATLVTTDDSLLWNGIKMPVVAKITRESGDTIITQFTELGEFIPGAVSSDDIVNAEFANETKYSGTFYFYNDGTIVYLSDEEMNEMAASNDGLVGVHRFEFKMEHGFGLN